MSGSFELIKVASGDAVGKKLQNHPLYQAVEGDDRFIKLLSRLSEVEKASVRLNTT